MSHLLLLGIRKKVNTGEPFFSFVVSIVCLTVLFS